MKEIDYCTKTYSRLLEHIPEHLGSEKTLKWGFLIQDLLVKMSHEERNTAVLDHVVPNVDNLPFQELFYRGSSFKRKCENIVLDHKVLPI